jgi:hypothetical protein
MPQKITYKPKLNYYIIAIASVLKDYRLSFYINQDLHLNLEKTDDLVAASKSKEESKKFSKYYFLDERSEFEYFLLQNKQWGDVFLKTYKNFDFLLILKTIDEDSIDIGSIFEKIKAIYDIQLALELEDLKPGDIKLVEQYF